MFSNQLNSVFKSRKKNYLFLSFLVYYGFPFHLYLNDRFLFDRFVLSFVIWFTWYSKWCYMAQFEIGQNFCSNSFGNLNYDYFVYRFLLGHDVYVMVTIINVYTFIKWKLKMGQLGQTWFFLNNTWGKTLLIVLAIGRFLQWLLNTWNWV